MLNLILSAAFFLPLQQSDEAKDNWHQFRGPNGTGAAPRGTPPTKWSEKENIAWKVELPGRGSATPIVWKDKVFILSAIRTEKKAKKKKEVPEKKEDKKARRGMKPPTNFYQFVVLCLDRKTGRTLWKRVANEELPHEGKHPHSTYASSTPATDGKFLYASFGSRGLYCYDLEGVLQWKRNFGEMKIHYRFGEGISPVIYGDSLIHLWDHEGQSYLYCLDARTGKDRWKIKRDERTTWQTPLIVDQDGVQQVVVNGQRRAKSYDLRTGKVLWECGGMKSNPITTPLASEGLVYLSTGFRKYAINAVDLKSRGDVTGKKQVVWGNQEAAPYVASPFLSGGLLYLTKDRNAFLSCLDAKTGKVHYRNQRLVGIRTIYASLAGAEGKVYIVGRRGTTVVVKQGTQFEILATNRLDEGIDASPVIVGRQLFLRGKRHLYCIERRDY